MFGALVAPTRRGRGDRVRRLSSWLGPWIAHLPAGLALRHRIGRVRRTLPLAVTACILVALAAPPSALGIATRACGMTQRDIGAIVRASRDVSCSQARRIIHKVIGGSRECYSAPGRFHPCTLEGFHCTAHFQGETSHARCVKRRGLITGRTR